MAYRSMKPPVVPVQPKSRTESRAPLRQVTEQNRGDSWNGGELGSFQRSSRDGPTEEIPGRARHNAREDTGSTSNDSQESGSQGKRKSIAGFFEKRTKQNPKVREQAVDLIDLESDSRQSNGREDGDFDMDDGLLESIENAVRCF